MNYLVYSECRKFPEDRRPIAFHNCETSASLAIAVLSTDKHANTDRAAKYAQVTEAELTMARGLIAAMRENPFRGPMRKPIDWKMKLLIKALNKEVPQHTAQAA